MRSRDSSMRRPIVLCFGEILWDILPSGRFPGGAPFNVAYHLHQLGADVRLLSGIGRDAQGDELLRLLRQWGISTGHLTLHRNLPTGTVVAELDPGGDAHYSITAGVAWDDIRIGEHSLRAAAQAHSLVHGSLALRSAANHAALDRLTAAMPADAWRVFDVNLRPPHDDLDLVRRCANRASLFKLNCDEAARLTDSAGGAEPGAEEGMARALAETHACPRVCITCGARGAGLLAEGTWHWEPGRPVAVVDTVGAGDAFLASLLSGLLAGGRPPAECLSRASRHGEWVASKPGATPDYQGA